MVVVFLGLVMATVVLNVELWHVQRWCTVHFSAVNKWIVENDDMTIIVVFVLYIHPGSVTKEQSLPRRLHVES